MKKNFIIVFATVLLLSTHILTAGPFGLEMGMSLDGLNALGANPTIIAEAYYTVNPPSPHSDFEEYIVRLDPTEGVFWIKALGKDISDSGYGFSTKSKFSETEQALSSAYGTGELVNFLFPGSIWDELEDWMMSLCKDERFYFKKWEKSDGTAIANGILSIYLGANATSSSKGYLTLEYYGIEHERLSQKAKDEQSKVF
jgi:hypothetical protein